MPAMVLLAAAAIFAGYYWLRFIPDGSLRPPGLLAALAAVPATLGLTRHATAGRALVARRVACGAAVALPFLALVGLVTHGTGWNDALGAAALVLAAALLALAAVSEHAEHPRAQHRASGGLAGRWTAPVRQSIVSHLDR